MPKAITGSSLPPLYRNRYSRVLGVCATDDHKSPARFQRRNNGRKLISDDYYCMYKTKKKKKINTLGEYYRSRAAVRQPPFIRHPRDDVRKRSSRIRVAIMGKNGFFFTYRHRASIFLLIREPADRAVHPSETLVFLLLLPPPPSHIFG